MSNSNTAKLTLRDINPQKSKLDGVSVEELQSNREKMSVSYMARYYGVSKSTIYRQLRKAGLIIHGKKES